MAAAAAPTRAAASPPTSRRRPATRRTPPRSKCRSRRRTTRRRPSCRRRRACGSPSSRASSATSPTTSSAASSPRRRCARRTSRATAASSRRCEGARLRRNSALLWRPFGRQFLAQFGVPRSDAPHPRPPVRGLRRRLRAADALGAQLARSAHRRVAGDPRHRRQRRRPAVPVRLGVQAGGGARRPRGHRRESVDGQPGEAVAPLLDGDGRVSSSADGAYETTANGTTVKLDDARHAAALRRAPRAVRLGRRPLRRRDGEVLALRDAPHQTSTRSATARARPSTRCRTWRPRATRRTRWRR